MAQATEIIDAPRGGLAVLELAPVLCLGSALLTTIEWSAYAYRAPLGIAASALVPALLLVSFLKFTAIVGGLSWNARQGQQIGLIEASFLAASVMGGGLLLSLFALNGL